MKTLKIFSFLLLLSSQLFYSQAFLQGKDLSTFKVASLSEAELVQIGKELDANQMTLEQVEPLALAKGMSKEEFIAFKARMESLPQIKSTVKHDAVEGVNASANVVDLAKKNNAVYGSELFTSKSLSFEPNQNLPTPSNYIIGPGDVVEFLIYGVQQFSYSGKVNKNGAISIPNVGDVFVSGITFDALKAKLKQKLSSVYSTLNGGSQLSITISNYRTILVTIIGAQQSGNYRLSSMSSVFNALHVAGGPSDIGSYRKIELIRNNKVIRTIDLYRFLTKGDQSDNISLLDNDMIRIPSYDARVVLEGAVKNPGIFEVVSHEKLADIIQYAAGLTENAYTNRILVKQKTSTELKITDLNSENYKNYVVQAGDVVTIEEILDRYENRVQIQGAVYRPGAYSLPANKTLTLIELLKKADGLKENAYLEKATLIRQREDFTKEYININLKSILDGKSNDNYTLQKEDVFLIYYNQDLLDQFQVSIDGEVRKPGSYSYADGKTLYDLLLEADYFTNKAAGKVSVYRKKVALDYNVNNAEKIESFELIIDTGNPKLAAEFLLEPMDRVVVRRVPVYETPELITVSGEFLYSGPYAILSKEERIDSFVSRSGGFTDEADVNAMRVIRNGKNIPIDWLDIKANNNSLQNLILEPSDVLVVPKRKQTVLVAGAVMFDTEVPYKKGKGLRYYLRNAGGNSDKGWLKKAYVVHANGSAKSSSSFLGIKNYPKIEAGSKIIIPEKPERKGTTTGEVIGIASILTSLAGVLFAAFR